VAGRAKQRLMRTILKIFGDFKTMFAKIMYFLVSSKSFLHPGESHFQSCKTLKTHFIFYPAPLPFSYVDITVCVSDGKNWPSIFYIFAPHSEI